MKKILFGLIATMFFGLSANAQDVINKNNPYDFAGVQHNQVVREFLKKHGSKNLSNEKTLELTNSICKSLGIKGETLTIEQFNFGMKDLKNNFKETVSKSSLSLNGKVELQKIFDFMLNNGFKGNVSFAESIDFFLKFESNVLINKNLTKSDMEFLLKSASVGRHSICLWKDYFRENISTKTENIFTIPQKWIRYLIVASADVAGGIVGGGAFSVASGAGASTLAVEVIDKAK
jgi:hypothetical protein